MFWVFSTKKSPFEQLLLNSANSRVEFMRNGHTSRVLIFSHPLTIYTLKMSFRMVKSISVKNTIIRTPFSGGSTIL